MAKKAKAKKYKTIEEMTAAELRKHIPAEIARAERFAAVDPDLGPGWKMSAESVMRGVARAKDRLAELEGGDKIPLIGSEPVKGSVFNHLRGGKK